MRDSADKTALESKIVEVEALNQENYTSETWEALQEALEESKAIKEKANATQKEVNEAIAALAKAIEALIEKNPVAKENIIESSTQIDGVDFDIKEGVVTVNIDSNMDWSAIEQDPNTELGADTDMLYVGIVVNKPDNAEITYVLINDGTNDEVVKLGDHAATTGNGRYYYFAVAKKGTDGIFKTITDEKPRTRVVKWYNGKKELMETQTFEVMRREVVEP